jgi:hypothetical protein
MMVLFQMNSLAMVLQQRGSIGRTKVCRSFFLILLVVATLYLIRANAQAQQPAEDVRTGTISGRVVNENGQPLVGATVSVRTAGVVSAGRSTTSNLEGNFQITGLDNALYYVNANSPAYVTAPLDLDTALPTYRVGDSVRLELIRGGIVTGMVTNSTGDPVLGVRVRAFMVRDATGKPTRGAFMSYSERSTDDRGIYRIYGLAPGTYVVQAGGGGGPQSSLNATDFDAPTYAPSSTRDTAAEIPVRAGEESTVDIRYRNEPGHSISGKIRLQGNFGASINLTRVGDGLLPTSGAYQPSGAQGFLISGIGDGEYEIIAQEALTQTQAFPDMAATDPVRVTVRGADVTGLELIPKPLASISGKITLETSRPPECQNKRRPLFSETMVSLVQNRKEEKPDQINLFRLYVGTASPDKDGSFTLKNVRSGQYSFSPRFFARYWYLKSMTVSAAATTARQPKTTTSATTDLTRAWMQVKTGDRISGLAITLSEGAASIRGQIAKADDSKLESGLRVYLVPSEREKSNDSLRYFISELSADGTFSLSNLPPGTYWLLAQQPPADTPTSTEKLRLPDGLEARSNIRRAAESAKIEVELKPCQNLTDYKMPLK